MTLPLRLALDPLDLSCNLQTNYTINCLFRLNLIFHTYKIPVRCDRFEILNFASKQGLVPFLDEFGIVIN